MDAGTPAHLLPGVCQSCAHARTLVSRKGSQFLHCLRSESEPQYAKYPRLPVLQCAGYQPRSRQLQQQ